MRATRTLVQQQSLVQQGSWCYSVLQELQRITTSVLAEKPLVQARHQLTRRPLSPLDPLLPKLLPEHVVFHPDASDQGERQPQQVEHPRERERASEPGAQEPRGVRPRALGAAAQKDEREAERDGDDGAVARVPDDAVRAGRYELVAVLQRQLEGEVAS